MSAQSKLHSHYEALTQNIVGLLFAFIVLTIFGVAPETSLKIQASLFVVSYIRSYSIRRFYNWLFKGK
jgi:hypothetical protein